MEDKIFKKPVEEIKLAVSKLLEYFSGKELSDIMNIDASYISKIKNNKDITLNKYGIVSAGISKLKNEIHNYKSDKDLEMILSQDLFKNF